MWTGGAPGAGPVTLQGVRGLRGQGAAAGWGHRHAGRQEGLGAGDAVAGWGHTRKGRTSPPRHRAQSSGCPEPNSSTPHLPGSTLGPQSWGAKVNGQACALAGSWCRWSVPQPRPLSRTGHIFLEEEAGAGRSLPVTVGCWLQASPGIATPQLSHGGAATGSASHPELHEPRGKAGQGWHLHTQVGTHAHTCTCRHATHTHTPLPRQLARRASGATSAPVPSAERWRVLSSGLGGQCPYSLPHQLAQGCGRGSLAWAAPKPPPRATDLPGEGLEAAQAP